MKELSKLYKPFRITSICRQDIIDRGYPKEEVLDLKDEDMEYIAQKIESGIMEDFWLALDIIMEEKFFLKRSPRKE